MSVKVATLIMTGAMVLGGFILGYLKGFSLRLNLGWKLALILSLALPFLALGVGLFTHYL